MVAAPAIPFRSANAGELSQDAKGRVDIKQYYSAGLAYKNIEPVPQSGFRRMGGSWRKGFARKGIALREITSPTLDAGPHSGTQTVWTGTIAGTVALVYVPAFSVDAGTATFVVQAETAPGVWTQLGGSFAGGMVAVGRLAARAPGAQLTATGLRIRATFSEAASVTTGTVEAFFESTGAIAPRYIALTTDAGTAFSCYVTHGLADFFTDAGFVGSARLASVTSAMLPDLGFYAEASTIGIFHTQLVSQRLLQVVPGAGHEWQVDPWPYDTLPTADLGGVYPKTDDVWDLTLTFGSTTTTLQLAMLATVNGEPTSAVTVTDSGGTPVAPDQASADYTLFATNLEAALQALPSLGPDVSVAVTVPWAFGAVTFSITFGGALAGEEYEVSATITNTSTASALTVHREIGETDFEPLFSVTRGWPGISEIVQDRQAYGRIPAVTGALALSEVAEYFTLNLKSLGDNAARLDRIRSKTSELIVAIKEEKFLIVFTDRAAYFVTNRKLERNTPLNFIKASEIGAQPNCRPLMLDGVLHYVAIHPKGLQQSALGGKQLLAISQDATSAETSYTADPVSLLASHLIDGVIRSAEQKPETDLDATKGWLMRADGRLIAGQTIASQEILGFCEWIAAGGGLVREIGVDGLNRLWLAVQRGSDITIELYDMDIFLQDAMTVTPDLAGVVSGLPFANGTVLWAVADGFVVGPLTVAAGAVNLQDSYASAIIGRWQAPRFESMPQVYVRRNEEVILRPGRIHTAQINIVDTTSIAIGANGEDPEDFPLLANADLADTPMPGKTELIEANGLPGVMTGTTLVITQTRPGELRVRDYALGAKL